MHARTGAASGAILASMVILAAPGHAAGTPGQVCAGAKMKAAGKATARRLACHSKAARQGVAFADGGCLAAADARMIVDFGRAEARGGCVAPGDASHVANAIVLRVIGLSQALRPVATASHCAALKLKAAGKKAKSKLACHGKTMRNGLAVDPSCLAKAETRFTADFAKAEAHPPCLTTSDAAAIESEVDDLVDEVVTALPSVTTSTTPGTTTTTTLAGVCGDGVRDPDEQCDTSTQPECADTGRSGCIPPGGPHECVCCTMPGGTGLRGMGSLSDFCCNGSNAEIISPLIYFCPGTCGRSEFPSCGGSCQVGAVCLPVRTSSFDLCACVGPDACDASCGGAACPAGEVCRQTLEVGGPTCACEPL